MNLGMGSANSGGGVWGGVCGGRNQRVMGEGSLQEVGEEMVGSGIPKMAGTGINTKKCLDIA